MKKKAQPPAASEKRAGEQPAPSHLPKPNAPEPRLGTTPSIEKVDREKLARYAEKIGEFTAGIRKGSDLEILYHGDGDGVITAFVIGEIMRKLLKRKQVNLFFREVSPKNGALDGGQERLQDVLAAKKGEFHIFGCDLFIDSIRAGQKPKAGGFSFAQLMRSKNFQSAVWLDHHEKEAAGRGSIEALSHKLSTKEIMLISPTLLGSNILGRDGKVDGGAHNAASLAEALALQLGIRDQKIGWLADIAREADFAPARFGKFSPSSDLGLRETKEAAYMLNLVSQAGNGGGAIALHAIGWAGAASDLLKDHALAERFAVLRGHMAKFARGVLEMAKGKNVIVALLGDEVNTIGGKRYALASAMANEISIEHKELVEMMGNRPLILGVESGGRIKLSIRWNNFEQRDAGALIKYIGEKFGDEGAGGSKGAGGASIPLRGFAEGTMAAVEDYAVNWLSLTYGLDVKL